MLIIFSYVFAILSLLTSVLVSLACSCCSFRVYARGKNLTVTPRAFYYLTQFFNGVLGHIVVYGGTAGRGVL